jgi:hypothetical protein
MKKLKFYSLALIGAMFLSPALISCDNDDEEEIEILLPIAGDYIGSETCDAANGVPSSEYPMHIYNSANDPNTIWIDNAYGLGITLKGTWDGGNGFTLPSQDVSIKIGTTTYKGKISGSGKVEGNDLTFDFVTTEDLEDKCTYKGKREVLHPAIGS